MTRVKWLLAMVAITATVVSGIVVSTREGAGAAQAPAPAARGPDHAARVSARRRALSALGAASG